MFVSQLFSAYKINCSLHVFTLNVKQSKINVHTFNSMYQNLKQRNKTTETKQLKQTKLLKKAKLLPLLRAYHKQVNLRDIQAMRSAIQVNRSTILPNRSVPCTHIGLNGTQVSLKMVRLACFGLAFNNGNGFSLFW